MGIFHRTQEFIQFDLQRLGIPILCILNEEYHEKSNDGCAGIDDKLPSIAKMEDRTCDCPENNDSYRDAKSYGSASSPRRPFGGPRKPREALLFAFASHSIFLSKEMKHKLTFYFLDH